MTEQPLTAEHTPDGEARVPLHGRRTHPLSAHAREVLRRLESGPIPTQEINPGVVDRLQREGCVIVTRPSPYPSHRGKGTSHLALPPDHGEG